MIGVTVNCSVSVARKIASSHLSPEQSEEVYGTEYSPSGIGHNLRLEATFSGDIDPQTGLLMRYDVLQQLLKKVAAQIDHKLLNTDVLYFLEAVPTLEKIAQFIFEHLRDVTMAPINLERVRIYEGERLWVDVNQTSTLALTKVWRLQGFTQLQLTLKGPLDEKTGVIVARAPLDRVVEQNLSQLKILDLWQIRQRLASQLPQLRKVAILNHNGKMTLRTEHSVARPPWHTTTVWRFYD